MDAAGGMKKKRRKRKPPIPDGSATEPIPIESSPMVDVSSVKEKDTSPVNADVLAAQSALGVSADAPIGLTDLDVDDAEVTPLDLPDIREQRQRKKEKEDLVKEEEAEVEFKPKINRRDVEAMRKLIEIQPFGDADPSNFEEEEYGAVSALLSEKTQPFLGIPAGPIQVGHFIGAMGVVLMAFIEYPGFPLTNLPTPLRACFQSGLAVVYLINIVLAVFATFKAEERGQPKLLWAAKTFAVGGIALDQLTQLPTLQETNRRKSVKGKRALR